MSVLTSFVTGGNYSINNDTILYSEQRFRVSLRLSQHVRIVKRLGAHRRWLNHFDEYDVFSQGMSEIAHAQEIQRWVFSAGRFGFLVRVLTGLGTKSILTL